MQNSGQTGTKMTRDWKQWEGQIVNGNFPLRQYLGGSEHSAVFLTERRGQEAQRAAIKLIPANPATVELQLSRWESAAKLSHPHVLRLFETGSCQLDKVVLLYVVMEYAEDNLAQVLPHRALTADEARELLWPALDALTYLHGRSLVHTRIKPSNVMAAHDQLKLSSDSLVRSGDPLGRIGLATRYDAPDLTLGNISPAADTWSLGMTLMEALTQRLPAVEGMTEPLPETVPAPFMGIAHCCLRRDPQRRCGVAEIAARLKGPAPEAPKPSTLRIPAESGKWKYVLIAAVILLAIAVLVIAPKLGRSSGQRADSVPSEVTSPATPQTTESAPAAAVQSPGATQQESPPPAPGAKSSSTKPGPAAQSTLATPPPSIPAQSDSALPAAASAGSDQNRVLQQVEPVVAKSARATITGTLRVRIRVEVDASGNVESASFVSPGPSKYFARQAMEAAQQWKFAPSQDGQAAPSAWILHFGFRRSGTEIASEAVNR